MGSLGCGDRRSNSRFKLENIPWVPRTLGVFRWRRVEARKFTSSCLSLLHLLYARSPRERALVSSSSSHICAFFLRGSSIEDLYPFWEVEVSVAIQPTHRIHTGVHRVHVDPSYRRISIIPVDSSSYSFIVLQRDDGGGRGGAGERARDWRAVFFSSFLISISLSSIYGLCLSV